MALNVEKIREVFGLKPAEVLPADGFKDVLANVERTLAWMSVVGINPPPSVSLKDFDVAFIRVESDKPDPHVAIPDQFFAVFVDPVSGRGEPHDVAAMRKWDVYATCVSLINLKKGSS